MAFVRWIAVAALALGALACEIRDDGCPSEPRDGTLCFDEESTCRYGSVGDCSPEWECRCEGGRWDCRRTDCPDAGLPDAWSDVPAWDVAQDLAPEAAQDLAWKDVPPEVAQDVPPGGCPADAPVGVSSGCAAEGQRCEYGQECCCGQCAPSLVCTCQAGQWGCYYTDFCMIPGCPDVADVPPGDLPGEASPTDAAEGADAPDVPPVEPGRCRTDADCDSGRTPSFCAPPDAPQTCGICFRPERTCGTDADCASTPEAPVCAPSRTPCLCEPGVGECMPRCDAAGTTQACDPVTQQCDGATGLCVTRRCARPEDCPVNFRCGLDADPATCGRMACSWDPDCDVGWCVRGACYDQPGTCDFMKP